MFDCDLDKDPVCPKKIAVIGSGISGLSAAWLLSKGHEVTLFEASEYLGGHAHTVDIEVEDNGFPVDTGFIVYNPQNYPNLTALFDYLAVPSRGTDMSFSASVDNGTFEYAGGSASVDNGTFEYAGGTANGLFAQKRNLLRPAF